MLNRLDTLDELHAKLRKAERQACVGLCLAVVGMILALAGLISRLVR